MNGGWGISNAGIVDLGKQTLVFDTGLTPHAARDLRSAAEVLTGRMPDYVVNSHHHNDHIRGNQVFPEAMVVSTVRTFELIASQGHDDIEADRKQAPGSLAEMKTLAESQDLEDRRMGTFWLPYWEGILASFSELQLRFPELTFKDQLIFRGTARTAQLLATSGGHTESDCLLFLPQERVVFCGDLLFVECHPYLGDCDPEAYLSILDRLKGLAAEVYVPGHGPVGGREDLDKMKLYVRTLMQQAQEAVARGMTAEAFAKHTVPEPFASWTMAKPFYDANLRFMHSRMDQT